MPTMQLDHIPLLRATVLAARFARELGLPPGNFWEPTIVRHLTADFAKGDAATVEAEWRARLDLDGA